MDPMRQLVRQGIVDGLILTATTLDDPRACYLRDHKSLFAKQGRAGPSAKHPLHASDIAELGSSRKRTTSH